MPNGGMATTMTHDMDYVFVCLFGNTWHIAQVLVSLPANRPRLSSHTTAKSLRPGLHVSDLCARVPKLSARVHQSLFCTLSFAHAIPHSFPNTTPNMGGTTTLTRSKDAHKQLVSVYVHKGRHGQTSLRRLRKLRRPRG